MGDFFKGWRRKAGLVVLVMACVLAVGWMRSYVTKDELPLHAISFPVSWITSSDSGIEYWTAIGREKLVPRLNGGKPVMIFEKTMMFRVPYWSLVLPLTLLSAWLILGKSRKAKNVP